MIIKCENIRTNGTFWCMKLEFPDQLIPTEVASDLPSLHCMTLCFLCILRMLYASRLSTTPTRSMIRHSIFSWTGPQRRVDA